MDSISVFLNAENEEEREDEENCINLNAQRKFLRSWSSPLDIPHKEFVKLFRLSKEAFVYILDEIKEDFKSHHSSSLPPTLKLAASLRFLAEGSYQKSVGQDYHIAMAQSTISKVLSETLDIMEKKLCPKLIKFDMTENEKIQAKKYFFEKSGFPGVIMCVDGTHVNIVRPSKNEHHFFNRRGQHSLNVMMICDHTQKITCVNASYGGSSHDSVIWSMSSERKFLEDKFKGKDNSKILGDAGYSLEPWLMTPYRPASSNSREAKYNTVHSKCRSIIERCFGVLKGRFRCLIHSRELHYGPEKAALITNVCAMLHNVCVMFKVDFDEGLFVEEHDDIQLPPPENVCNYKVVAKQIRDSIRDAL